MNLTKRTSSFPASRRPAVPHAVLAASLAALLVGLGCVTAAHAQSAQPYLGIGGGLADAQVGGHSDSAPALQLLAGLQFNRNFALEFSYLVTSDFDPPGQDFSLSSIGAAGLFILPIGIGSRDSWSLYGKLGLSQTSALYMDANGSATVDDFGLNYGLGVQYATSRTFALRLGRDSRPYARGQYHDDVTTTTLSGVFRF